MLKQTFFLRGILLSILLAISASTMAAQHGEWYGLYVGYGGQISLTYCSVKHAAYGIYAYKPNSLNVDNCLFEKNTTAGIYYSGKADASDPLIRYSRIQDCGTYGVFCGPDKFMMTQ
jgi:hypothetical protein